MSLIEEPHRALREVERLTRNPEKLANAGGRCWKDTLGRKRSLRPTGLLTLPGEDWSPPGKRPRNSYMMMDSNKKSGQRRQRGHLPKGRWIRVRQGWRQQVVNQRKPCSRRKERLFLGLRRHCLLSEAHEKRCAWAHGMLERCMPQDSWRYCCTSWGGLDGV